MTKIKQCGITNLQDARHAITCGADFLGFIFAVESPRSVSPATAASIVEAVKANVKTVAVFRNWPLEQVNKYSPLIPFDYVQLHGDESPDYCRAMAKPVIKVIEIDEKTSNLAEQVAPYEDCSAYILFDKPKRLQLTDWLEIALQKIEDSGSLPPYFFAGGLNTANVGNVLAHISPFALDVASGTESEPGKKDFQKVSDFCQAVADHRKLQNEVAT